jgi:hypothetical protein
MSAAAVIEYHRNHRLIGPRAQCANPDGQTPNGER